MAEHSIYINEFKRDNKRYTFLEVFFPFFYILSQYSFGFSSFGVIILFCYCGIHIFIKRKIYINKWLMLFLCYAIINQMIVYTFSHTWSRGNINSFIFMIISVVAIFVLCDEINLDHLFKIYAAVASIVIVALLIQSILYYVFNQPVYPIRIMPILQGDQHFWYSGGNRPSSFFTEPQAFASYLLPFLCLCFLKNKFAFACAVSLAIVLSTSSQGIALCAVMWMFFIFKYLKNNIYRLFLIVAFVVAGILFFTLPIFNETVTKLHNINLSYDIRLTRGFSIFGAMPLEGKLTGLGYGNVVPFLLSGEADLFWIPLTRPELLGYATTMSAVFIYYGVIGGILFLTVFLGSLFVDDKRGRMFLLVIFICCFTQTILFNAWFLFYWIFYFNLCDKTKYPANYIVLSLRQGNSARMVETSAYIKH